jgi:hypothetical protein
MRRNTSFVMADAYDILSTTKWILSPVDEVWPKEEDDLDDEEKKTIDSVTLSGFAKIPKELSTAGIIPST